MQNASHDTLRPVDLVGPRAARYAGAFARFESRGGHWAPSWNFAAFFASTAWFAYRRMWVWAAANALLVGLGFAAITASSKLDHALGADGGYWDNPWTFFIHAWIVGAYLGVPLCADWLYFRHLKARLARATPPHEGNAPGAMALVACLLVLGIMISLQWMFMQSRPRARERIAIATLMAFDTRTRIAEFHETHRRLPLGHESAAFASTFDNKEARSIAYDAGHRMVIITLGTPFEGRRFGYQAEVRDGKLTWTCRTIDLSRRFLPATCQD
jgi:hypothetical protein